MAKLGVGCYFADCWPLKPLQMVSAVKVKIPLPWGRGWHNFDFERPKYPLPNSKPPHLNRNKLLFIQVDTLISVANRLTPFLMRPSLSQ